MSPGSYVHGNTINSTEQHLYSEIGETITLSCTYSSSSSGPYLFWYRQYPHQIQYILVQGAKTQANYQRNNIELDPGRFQSETNNSHTTLTIHGLSVSDSAVYLCALSDGAQCCKRIQVQY
ncbi:immunoglobulin superfamily member 6 [Aquarana catesbeiana]|uniref:immunoglobulin superfamily member 6 n=1 Tax=Aquarana catesbeiana TaxID=8400 RepID=UPI003CC9BD85